MALEETTTASYAGSALVQQVCENNVALTDKREHNKVLKAGLVPALLKRSQLPPPPPPTSLC